MRGNFPGFLSSPQKLSTEVRAIHCSPSKHDISCLGCSHALRAVHTHTPMCTHVRTYVLERCLHGNCERSSVCRFVRPGEKKNKKETTKSKERASLCGVLAGMNTRAARRHLEAKWIASLQAAVRLNNHCRPPERYSIVVGTILCSLVGSLSLQDTFVR